MKTAIKLLAGFMAVVATSAQAFIIITDDSPTSITSVSQPVVVLYPAYPNTGYFGPKGNMIYTPQYPSNFGYYNSRVYGNVGFYPLGQGVATPTPLQTNMGRAHYFSNK